MIPALQESLQREIALQEIADAMAALRFEKELGSRIANAKKAADAARKLLNDARKITQLCDRAGLEVSAVLRRARNEGLL